MKAETLTVQCGNNANKMSWILRDNPWLVSTSDEAPQPPAGVHVNSKRLDVAHHNACAVARGTGYCWGAVVESPGEPISKTDRAIPEAIVTPEPILRIATTRTLVDTDFGAPIVQPQRWCASAVTGEVYCGGYNASGQAGDGTKDFALDAVKVAGLPGPAADVKTTPDASRVLRRWTWRMAT